MKFDLLIECILNNSSDHLILLEGLSKIGLRFKLILTKSLILNLGILLVLLYILYILYYIYIYFL